MEVEISEERSTKKRRAEEQNFFVDELHRREYEIGVRESTHKLIYTKISGAMDQRRRIECLRDTVIKYAKHSFPGEYEAFKELFNSHCVVFYYVQRASNINDVYNQDFCIIPPHVVGQAKRSRHGLICVGHSVHMTSRNNSSVTVEERMYLHGFVI